MKRTLLRFFRDEKGVAAIECALIAALLSVGALMAMTAVGTTITTILTSIARAL